MTARRVVIATKNPDKLVEVRRVLAPVAALRIVDGFDWPDVPETADTLEGNALLKAEAVVAATGVDALADDTGLEVDALGGAPGVHTARYSGPGATYESNREALLAALEGAEDRTARFRTVIALVGTDGSRTVVDGVLDGRITTEERGTGGFGYDPVFELDDGRTLAEVGLDDKNVVSHRGRALRALVAALDAGSASQK